MTPRKLAPIAVCKDRKTPSCAASGQLRTVLGSAGSRASLVFFDEEPACAAAPNALWAGCHRVPLPQSERLPPSRPRPAQCAARSWLQLWLQPRVVQARPARSARDRASL